MIYIADIEYSGNYIESLLYGEIENEYSYSVDTYSPSYTSYRTFTGVEFYKNTWYVKKSSTVNILQSAIHSNEKQAQIVMIKLIFFDEE